jgi:c-di-GMP-binding flagellar brake protein YcgR
MRFEELKVGTRLELELLDSKGERIGNIYISQILDAVRRDNIIVSAPIYESRLIFIPVGAKMRITFYHKRYGLLGFTAIVSKRDYRDNVAVLYLHTDAEMEKIQRRKHYRLDCFVNAEYSVFVENVDENVSIQSKKALTRNISGSGVCILVGEDIPKKTRIEVTMHLGPNTQVKALCAVMRNTPVEIKSITNYELGLHFLQISPKDQDSLIRYIFEQQRVLLKKDILDK